MSFWQRIRDGLTRMMIGRHGADELSFALLIAGLLLSMLGNLTRLALLDLLGMAAYIYGIYRMFSRQHEKRLAENRKYLQFFGGFANGIRQFGVRMKNRNSYKYFKCPQCHARLRLPRNVGEVTVTCGQCKHSFKKKA